MARTVGADAEATRRRILDSAIGLFAAQGRGTISIRQIAREAGVSLGMVHHYYGSKDELYTACLGSMDQRLEALWAHVRETVAAGGSLEELVDSVLRAAFRHARDHQPAMRLLLREVVSVGDLDPRRRDAFQVPFLAEASSLLAGVVGRPPETLRVPLQSLVFLVGRYAISADEELLRVTQARSVPAAIAHVEAHLIAFARATLGLPLSVREGVRESAAPTSGGSKRAERARDGDRKREGSDDVPRSTSRRRKA